MQLSIKALLIVGTLAGLALASSSKGGNYHHKGGVIKRTILIDGCTGLPIDKHPYPEHRKDEVNPGLEDTRPPPLTDTGFDDDETIFEDLEDTVDDFDFFNGNRFFNGDDAFGDDGGNLVYQDEPIFGPI